MQQLNQTLAEAAVRGLAGPTVHWAFISAAHPARTQCGATQGASVTNAPDVTCSACQQLIAGHRERSGIASLSAIEAKLDDMVAGPAGLDERFDDLQAQLNEMGQHMTRLSQINLSQLEALLEIARRVPALDILQVVADRIEEKSA